MPNSHRIVLDASLASESPQAVAAVLGHEADHARDTFQYGPPRSEAACYTSTKKAPSAPKILVHCAFDACFAECCI